MFEFVDRCNLLCLYLLVCFVFDGLLLLLVLLIVLVLFACMCTPGCVLGNIVCGFGNRLFRSDFGFGLLYGYVAKLILRWVPGFAFGVSCGVLLLNVLVVVLYVGWFAAL